MENKKHNAGKGNVYKVEWQLSEELIKLLKDATSVEYDESYYDDVQWYVEHDTCIICDKEIVRNGHWTEENEKEFCISGLCKECQTHAFRSEEGFEDHMNTLKEMGYIKGGDKDDK